MGSLRTLVVAVILCGAVWLLFAALDRAATSSDESSSELSATAESAVPLESLDVTSPAGQQRITEQTQEESGNALAVGGLQTSDIPSDLAPIPPDEEGAAAAVQGVVDLIQSQPSQEYRLEHEPIDPNWAPAMESTIWSAASVVGEVREVECRTTYCVAFLSPLEPEAVGGISNDQELVPNQRVLTDVFGAIIRNSNGRLAGFSIGRPPPFNEQQSNGEIVVTLSGRPIEDAGSTTPGD